MQHPLYYYCFSDVPTLKSLGRLGHVKHLLDLENDVDGDNKTE